MELLENCVVLQMPHNPPHDSTIQRMSTPQAKCDDVPVVLDGSTVARIPVAECCAFVVRRDCGFKW